MKILFINDSTSNPNWGDRAAAIALKKMIADSRGDITNVISEEELYGSLFSKNKTKRNDEQVVKQGAVNQTAKLLMPPILLKAREMLWTYFSISNHDNNPDVVPKSWEDFAYSLQAVLTNAEAYADLLTTIEQSDLAVIHGDGCMVGNTRIARTQLFLTYIIKRHFKKPVIIVNHTADFDHPNLHRMAQEVYPLFDDVVFRDSISAGRCQAFCNGRVAADSAFMFKPISLDSWLPAAQRLTYFDVWPDTAQFNPAEPYICIGGSSLYYYNKKYDPIKEFSLLINHVKSIYSGQIILTASDLRDQNIFRPIAKCFNLPLIGLRTPVQQSVDIVGNAEAYIGGRWHPSIFALRGGTPVLPISSLTFKMQALAEMSGLSSSTFNALNLEQEKKRIGYQLRSYLEQGSELRNRLRSWAEKECEKSWNNVTYLQNMSGYVSSSD
ncbi:MAG: polysaccharide pyruvyl transferase family protein [Nitrososphaera sp.]|nr:polysaccharide pyruvyl transferase family protein [Nitrososphaera sp.]